MDMVFEKTRELGEALQQSEAYNRMKKAEEKAMQNIEAAEMMAQYLEKRGQIQEMMEVENPDPAVMQRLSNEMDEIQERLQMIDDIVELTTARSEFNALIAQINQVAPSNVSVIECLATIAGIRGNAEVIGRLCNCINRHQSHFQVTVSTNSGVNAGNFRSSRQGEPSVGGGNHHDDRDHQHADSSHQLGLNITFTFGLLVINHCLLSFLSIECAF